MIEIRENGQINKKSKDKFKVNVILNNLLKEI